MATFTKRGKRWRVQVLVDGERRSGTFDTKAEASGVLPRRLQASGAPPSTRRRSRTRCSDCTRSEGASRSDLSRSKRLQNDPLADLRLADVAMSDLGDFRDRRIEAASAASARCELNLIRGMFRREWGRGLRRGGWRMCDR